MDIGKLPSHILARLLGQVPITDPRVLVGPRVGEDAALIDYGDRILVASSDPITFATDLIGWYAVQVNANDIAVMGGTPRWFLCTLLLPPSASESDAQDIFAQLVNACQSLGVSLVGGHTEITHNLDRPIAVGLMLGEVEKGKEVLTSGAREGDAILLTKGIAIEGTAILAREAKQLLESRGVPPDVLQRAQEFLFRPGLSVVADAQTLCRAADVHALHDPTEGGLATGLWELAEGAGVGVEIERERIDILAETTAICHAAELDPLGLLASGSLLAAIPPAQATSAVHTLKEAGIPAQAIGRVVPREKGLRLDAPSGAEPLPTFARDELARFLSRR